MISTHQKRPLTKAWGQIVEYCRRRLTRTATDPKTQPEFLYRRGSLVRLSENCLAADSTEIKLVSFVAGRVTDKSDGADLAEPGEMLGFGFGCDF